MICTLRAAGNSFRMQAAVLSAPGITAGQAACALSALGTQICWLAAGNLTDTSCSGSLAVVAWGVHMAHRESHGDGVAARDHLGVVRGVEVQLQQGVHAKGDQNARQEGHAPELL